MDSFTLQLIDTEFLGALPTQLDMFQAKNPTARLVSVMLLPRYSKADQYQAVWAVANRT